MTKDTPSDLIIGFHAVQSLLKTRPERARELIVQGRRKDERLQKTVAMAERHKIPIKKLTADEMTSLADSDKHQGCILKAGRGKMYDEKLLSKDVFKLSQDICNTAK